MTGPPEAMQSPAKGPIGSESRVPLALQAVFIAANRGKDVDKPPPEKAAYKSYFRGMFRLGKKKDSNKSKTKSKPPTEVRLASQDSPELISNAEPPKAPPAPKPKTTGRPPMSPQAYLDVLIHSRGYSTRRYRTLQTGYYSKPTAFQQASYNVYLVKLVRAKDEKKLRSVIKAGISPNPCNAYGESLVHMVCRRGDHELLGMLLEVGTTIQVSDDYGRTPLHDACWAANPSFETVELIAGKDIALFHMTDSRGAVPLSYVRKEHWPLCKCNHKGKLTCNSIHAATKFLRDLNTGIDFLDSKKDEWWPPKIEDDNLAPLIDMAPNDCPVPEPANSLSIELVKMVASGVMSPAEAKVLMEEDDGDEESDSDDDDEDEDSESVSDEDSDEEGDDDDSSSEYDSSSSEYDDMGFSPDDMANMLSRLEHSKQNSQ